MEKTYNAAEAAPRIPAKLPEKTLRAGAISLSIWRNPGENDSFYRTIAMERNYKDKDGNWRKINSLRVNDLPKAVVLIQKAYEYILMGGE